ncbi:hypothetical protein FE257_004589 [Aspergillus nanangensis]|uniref:Uncharacterized protein n=1 Tax=Aspergillus nanangensis TaxID=2582783 RepID=A0AAD4CYS5_ASPNN|nr:hypothetical protein FE257_004589 [Aspergillus nanangensis]
MEGAADAAQQRSALFRWPNSAPERDQKNGRILNKVLWGNTHEPTGWTPLMLRPITLLPLAVFCFGMIAALEAFHYVIRTTVMSPEDKNAFNLARYMPTLGVIAIGYVFKGIASDLKKLTPWSNMSGKWTTGSDSVLLDYANELEIVSVFAALRRRHWAMSVGLIGAFICGALVPFANSLTYVDLFASRTLPATFVQTSAFDFDNNPLATANGSLNVPWNYTGSQPYARVYSEQASNSPPALWSTGNYTFDEFGLSDDDSTSLSNATFTADVNAISATLDCHQVRYDRRDSEYSMRFVANPDDLKTAACVRPVEMSLTANTIPSQAWLNVTQCAEDGSDVRITANFMYGAKTGGDRFGDAENVSLKGLLCTPRFASQVVSLSVNATTDEVTGYTPVGGATPLDIKTSTEALWVYLDNPLDASTQEAFGRGPTGGAGPYDATAKPEATIKKIVGAVGWTVSRQELDAFMSVLLKGGTEPNPEDLDLLEARVVDLASRIWVETISFLARSPSSKSLAGDITDSEPRILLRIFALRTAEALLGVIGVLAVVFALRLRPKTVLERDPGSLAATAAILSASTIHTEKGMAKEAISSDDSMKQALHNTRFTLERNNDGEYGVAMHSMQGQTQMAAADRRTLGNVSYHAAPDGRDLDVESKASDVSKGWRPLPLHIASKIALGTAIILVMIALGIMLWQSNKLHGLCRDTPSASTALTLVTSGILVLLGYCCAGVDAAAQSLAPFNIMQKKPNPHVLFTDDLSFLGRFRDLGSRRVSIALLASAAYMVVIPALKLVAAGLFVATATQVADQVNVDLDTSLVSNFERTFTISETEEIVKRAAQFTEWESIPQFDLPARSGIIGNLVLSNLTAIAGDAAAQEDSPAGGTIEARVPAIAIDVKCDALPGNNFNLSIEASQDKDWNFEWFCTTPDCNAAFNTTRNTSMAYLYTSQYPDGLPSYVGQAAFPGVNSKYGPMNLIDLPYTVTLADYSSLGGSLTSFTNKTHIATYNESTTWATPDTLSVPLPTLRAISCTRNLSAVTVNATFTRPSQALIGGGKELLPWRAIAIDRASITYDHTFPRMQPPWFAPPILREDQYNMQSQDMDGKLIGNSLWPRRGSSTNIFELLASDAEHRAHHLARLLDPDGLATSAQRVYTAYCAQLLTELRLYAGNASAPAAESTSPATLRYLQPRMRQDPAMTYAIEGLLAAVVGFLVLIFWQFQSRPIIPKSPGSIAAS